MSTKMASPTYDDLVMAAEASSAPDFNKPLVCWLKDYLDTLTNRLSDEIKKTEGKIDTLQQDITAIKDKVVGGAGSGSGSGTGSGTGTASGSASGSGSGTGTGGTTTPTDPAAVQKLTSTIDQYLAAIAADKPLLDRLKDTHGDAAKRAELAKLVEALEIEEQTLKALKPNIPALAGAEVSMKQAEIDGARSKNKQIADRYLRPSG
jgi:hypothetical protein